MVHIYPLSSVCFFKNHFSCILIIMLPWEVSLVGVCKDKVCFTFLESFYLVLSLQNNFYNVCYSNFLLAHGRYSPGRLCCWLEIINPSFQITCFVLLLHRRIFFPLIIYIFTLTCLGMEILNLLCFGSWKFIISTIRENWNLFSFKYYFIHPMSPSGILIRGT